MREVKKLVLVIVSCAFCYNVYLSLGWDKVMNSSISELALLESMYTKESLEPTERNVTKEKSNSTENQVDISACILVKDENDNLIEWIAYHYYMTNMRHLVVCVDPTSVSSPKLITNRWTSRYEKLGLTVDIWNDTQYAPRKIWGKAPSDASYDDVLARHRLRQLECYKKCTVYLKQKKRKWTIFIDPDEYMSFNPISHHDSSLIYQYINSSYQIIWNEASQKTRHFKRRRIDDNVKIMWEKRRFLPTKNTIANYMTQETQFPLFSQLNCIVLPRLMFGSHVETNTTILQRHMPPNQHYYNANNFTTLRHFSHGAKGDFNHNKYGKCLIDVSRIERPPPDMKSIHYMVPKCGNGSAGWAEHDVSLFRVNHYVKSKEAFTSRIDIRRNEKMFSSRDRNEFVSHDMQGWLHGFVNLVGFNISRELLKDVGTIGKYLHDEYNFMKT